MAIFPVFWISDYQPDLLSGLGLAPPVVGDPVVLVQRRPLHARWPPPEPVWEVGAEPYWYGPTENWYAGPASAYSGEVVLGPGAVAVAADQLALMNSLGMRVDLLYFQLGGVPTESPQSWGQYGTLQVPDAWNTEELATDVTVWVFPPAGGWCRRASLMHPLALRRVAERAPERGPRSFDLADNRAGFYTPVTSGELTYQVEINGELQERTVAYEAPDAPYSGGAVHSFLPADGWWEPGWSGRCFQHAESGLFATAPGFEGSLPVDFGAEPGQVVRWRQLDHEGRSTPWLRYLVPPHSGLGPQGWPGPEPYTVGLDEPVQWHNLAHDADGHLVRWEWNLGDGTFVNREDPAGAPESGHVQHSYTAPAVVEASLKVFDNDGLSHTSQATVRVVDYGQMLGRVLRPDSTLRLAVHRPAPAPWEAPPPAAPERVEIVACNPRGPHADRTVLWQQEELRWPSLWQEPDGTLVLLAHETQSGITRRRSSRDGGSTWL